MANVPLTVAERSDYRETSRHADVLRFIDELLKRRPLFRVESIGKSGLGQDMPALFFGDARPGLPTVLVIANIHAGEVEGKEALLMLARDLPESTFEKLNLIFLPDYNPDGNDRIDVKNRALDLAKLEGQIGPEGGVGTRYTGQGINLNRDYMKMEAPESRNLSKLFGARWPDLTIDCHTTDGSIHGYALTFDTSHLPSGPCEYARTRLLPEVSKRLEGRTGLRTFFYGNFVDEKDLSKGWATYSHLPRYGSHYRGLAGRMDILLETYSYIPFRDRVFAMKETLTEILDGANEHAAEIRSRCLEGEVSRPDPVGIAYGPPQPHGECEILAWDMESQLARKIPGKEAARYRMPHLRKFVPVKTVRRPWAYLIRQDQRAIAVKLADHNIPVERLAHGAECQGETYKILKVAKVPSPDVGSMKRVETVVSARAERGPFRVRMGDYIVRTDHRLGTLACYLLEPESDDGLARWGYFDGSLRPGAEFPVFRALEPQHLELEIPQEGPPA